MIRVRASEVQSTLRRDVYLSTKRILYVAYSGGSRGGSMGSMEPLF